MDTVSAPSAKQSSQQPTAGDPLRPAAITAEGIGKLWLLAAAAVVVLALVAALIYSGAAATRQLSDPGALTRWGLPAAKAVHNLALAAVIGSLVFAVAIVPKRLHRSRKSDQQDDSPEHPAFTRVLALAAGGLLALAVAVPYISPYQRARAAQTLGQNYQTVYIALSDETAFTHEGKLDFVTMGRKLLADPHLPRKLDAGEPASVPHM